MAYSQADVDKVDLVKFPHLQKIPWWSAKMERGDCLFIPIGFVSQSVLRHTYAVFLLHEFTLYFISSSAIIIAKHELAAEFEPLK